ncbi:hypothetical protein DVA86_23710 [Streptomyces armeniacus]|uniref:Uncharacterized protein n=1 Tax=Streptomyces armeniacus TaxID=83291 RepID=A0A345XU79_9ACTN|nr:gephyrin-like molybdotransferase receptor GlpR [Streptomyces armeniacus]AXK35195.1 hypothetical protein DVA86_23710 [Streptomyces armeniacus]
MRVSSSGLIYAVIVGAWAAYLVPMWLRRQDELNEARPTERFSTAIRLLSGKAAMERRYAKDAERREAQDPESGALDVSGPDGVSDDDDVDRSAPDSAAEDAVDVRAFADPKTMVRAPVPADDDQDSVTREGETAQGADRGNGNRTDADRTDAERASAERKNAERKNAERNKRAKVLARRRRTTMVLFLAFTFGAIVAAVGGLAFLWAPAAPAALLSAYIVHLRTQERRRFTFTMDRRRAEEAAQQLRARRSRTGRPGAASHAPEPEPELDAEPAPAQVPPARRDGAPAASAAGHSAVHSAAQAPAGAPEAAPSADRRALVEQTDHAEWVDQERAWGREQPEGEGWDPVPVPLPTYVSAPVAPRTARGVDLDAPDTWSSARSSTAGTSTGGTGTGADSQAQGPAQAPAQRPQAGTGRDRGRTPLFDQYADEDRPRAVNE